MRGRHTGLLASVMGVLVLTSGQGALAHRGWAQTPPPASATVWTRWTAVDAVAPTPLRTLVVLGDSVPAGTGCACTAFGTLLARLEGGPITLRQHAVDGLTAAELAGELGRTGDTLRAELRSADVVTVTIGANDLLDGSATSADCEGVACYAGRLQALRGSLQRVLSQVRTLAPTAHLLVTGYWSVFLDGKVARSRGGSYVSTTDRVTRSVNSLIAAAARSERATYVDLYAAFKGDGGRDDTALLAPDGDHPSARGHRLIAGALQQALTG